MSVSYISIPALKLAEIVKVNDAINKVGFQLSRLENNVVALKKDIIK